MQGNPNGGQVRLLAYGGTNFTERRRIGAWPPIPSGTLQDLYGLAPGELAYGCGLLAGQPFLIVRQRQSVTNRGGYPYTLLLDPGLDTWTRFAWNPALLIHCILSQPALADLLLNSPDRCTEEGFSELLRNLTPLSVPHGGQPRNPALEALWVGAARSQGQIVAGPALLSLGGRPRPDAIAAILNPLRPCFRFGMGWLIGGGAAHGLSLGARLIFDEGAAESQDALREVTVKGRVTLENWQSLESRPDLASSLRVLARLPLWRWPADAARLLDWRLMAQPTVRPACEKPTPVP